MPLPAAWRWTCAGPFFFEAAGAAGPEIGLGLLSAGRLCTDAFVRLEEDVYLDCKALDGSLVVSLCVSPLFSIAGLKDLLENLSQTPHRYQQLVHGWSGQMLRDDQTVVDARLQDGSALLFHRGVPEDPLALLLACQDDSDTDDALLVHYILNNGEDLLMRSPAITGADMRLDESLQRSALVHATCAGNGDIRAELLENEKYTALNASNENGGG